MADPTTSRGLIEMATGTASGTWGAVLNASMIELVDQMLANTNAVSVSSSNVDLSLSQSQSLAFTLTGTLTSNINVTLPLASNSTTQAVGGIFVFDNQATGAFSVTVKTVASGSTGVEVPQGVKSMLYSNGSAVVFADDAQNRIQNYNGNPNGNVAGTAASVASRASVVIDRSTNTEYLCTTTGTAGAAVWSVNLPFTMPSQGYLTASSDATSPILTGDSVGASTIYYTAFRGNLFWVYNGVSFVPVPITGGQLALTLSSSAQASNGVYDVIGFLNGSTPTIGFSPAWSVATAGSGSRGTGAGTPQLTRVNGVLVNAVSQTVNNGSTTYSVASNRGTYLGSVFVDSAAGQVSCYVTYGQSRKWGVWNAFNRMPISLLVGDSTASWSYSGTSYRASRNTAANSASVFMGLAEEIVNVSFLQSVTGGDANIGAGPANAIGWNTTASPSGFIAQHYRPSGASDLNTIAGSSYRNVPNAGVNVVYCIERSNASGGTFYGTNSNMQMQLQWNG